MAAHYGDRFCDAKAPTGAEGSTMTEATTIEAVTAESLMDGIGEAVRADKAAYARIRANGRTLGYADDRKDGFVLSVAAGDVEGAPKRFKLEGEGKRRTMHVNAKNMKTARALVEWLAGQSS